MNEGVTSINVFESCLSIESLSQPFLNFMLYINIDRFLLADILDRVSPKFHELGLTYECIGGGRIKHDSKTQTIQVYGYSVVSFQLLIIHVLSNASRIVISEMNWTIYLEVAKCQCTM